MPVVFVLGLVLEKATVAHPPQARVLRAGNALIGAKHLCPQDGPLQHLPRAGLLPQPLPHADFVFIGKVNCGVLLGVFQPTVAGINFLPCDGYK